MCQNVVVQFTYAWISSVNQHAYVDSHPLLRFDDIVAKIGGSKYFSQIDLRDAFLQLDVDEPSRRFLVVATHKGIRYLQVRLRQLH